MRITNQEIVSTIEMDIANNVYHYGNEADCCSMTLDQLAEGIWLDLASWKQDGQGCHWKSDENRFDGKEKTIARIKPLLTKRLKELTKLGYKFKALK